MPESPEMQAIEIVIGRSADPLVEFAADELRDYLQRLFGVSAKIAETLGSSADCRFVVGPQLEDAMVAEALAESAAAALSEQGFLLRRAKVKNKPAVVVAGGSSNGVLWGVYELVEHYGVRYLLQGDVLPEDPGRFHLPQVDQVFEPLFQVRSWPFFHDHAVSPGSWSLTDQCAMVDQLAKLKFNRLVITTWPWEPYLHLEVDGVRKQWATMWFDYHYPITDDMPGRALFGDEQEFWHPDLPRPASYDQLRAAAESLFHRLIDHAHRRGMEVCFFTMLTEFSREFAPLVPGAEVVHQLNSLTVGPGKDVTPDDPDLAKICGAVIKAAVNTYPEVDLYSFGMSEWRGWIEQYARSWEKLDQKYGISRRRSLEDIIEQARQRTGYPGGAARALNEVKGDLAGLYFFDRLRDSPDILPRTRKPTARLTADYAAEELFPILGCLGPRGSEMTFYIDYTSSRVLRRRQVLADMPTDEVSATMYLTLHDDNVGVVPQLSTGSIHDLMGELRSHGWHGFQTRYWLPGDHEPCVAYLAKAAWDADLTPREAYTDHILAVCGPQAVEPLCKAFQELEAVTESLQDHSLGFSFPVPGMMLKHWQPGSFTDRLMENREGYRRALAAVRSAPVPNTADGKAYLDYWDHRLAFGAGYFDTVELVCKAATAEQAARQAQAEGNLRLAAAQLAETLEHARRALQAACTAIENFAQVPRSQSDRAAVAVMGEYVYRDLRRQVQRLSTELDTLRPPAGQ